MSDPETVLKEQKSTFCLCVLHTKLFKFGFFFVFFLLIPFN